MNKYSFKEILEKEISCGDGKTTVKFNRIEIPKIQRDYAQGRKEEGVIRDRFLEAIFSTLDIAPDTRERENELCMDFVYGSTAGNVFVPLDGQQRLTTLFLLYWYIGSRELQGIEKDALMNLLSKFTYETRSTSRQFCKNLVTGDKTCLAFKDPPGEEIRDSSWFYRSYDQDPTIKSMLTMLDSIHVKYGMISNKPLYQRLEKLNFYILSLDGFGLSDELYVRMNARGKPLTDAENFKADLTNWMKSDGNPYKNEYHRKVMLDGREMDYYLAFAQKMDANWTSFFWNITSANDKTGNVILPENRLVDPLFLRLFYRYCLGKLILQSSDTANTLINSAEYQTFYQERKYQNFDAFRVVMHENILTDFETFFDGFIGNNNPAIYRLSLPSWNTDGEFSFFDDAIDMRRRCIFLAVTLFLEEFAFDSVKFSQWMRVIWNIAENTDIDNATAMIGLMKLIQELSTHADDVYTFFADTSKQIESKSSANAVEEERRKCGFIVKDKRWEEVFIGVEKHPFFKGSVGFIINDTMTIDEFKHRADMASCVFDDKGVNAKYQNNGHIFLRAIISRCVNHENLEWKNFVDTDEKEHYLKKMLASNDTVRATILEWFSLDNEKVLETTINVAVSTDSQISGRDANDPMMEKRIRRAHEALYKKPDLQNWMQQKKAIRVSWRGFHLYVSRQGSWYDWAMLDSARNSVIAQLIHEKGFSTKQQLSYTETENGTICSIPYFWGNATLEVMGKIGDKEYRLAFDSDKILVVAVKNEVGEWKDIKTYDYVTEDEGLINKLETEIFKE